MRHGFRPPGVRRVAGLVAAAGLLGACTGGPSPPPEVHVGRGACGPGWAPAHGGDQSIAIRNVGIVTMEVDLVDPATRGIYAEIESLAPGSVRSIRVTLAPGRYAFSCYPADSDAETGPAVTITDGPAHGTPAVVPVAENDLAGPVRVYRAQVTAGLATLAGNAARLRTALRGGDRARAQAAWLTAQLSYSRLGAAYDTFGDRADAIDGLPADAHDRNFTGLRRIEYGLWHGEALPSLTAVADRLIADVAALRKDFGAERTDPNDLPLRAHEILESALQFELTGAADQGGGAGLAIISAGVDGTRMVLNTIAPVLAPRYPGWARTTAELDAFQRLVRAQQHGSRWTAPRALGRTDRQRLDGALGQLLEDLAPIASIGEVRRTG